MFDLVRGPIVHQSLIATIRANIAVLRAHARTSPSSASRHTGYDHSGTRHLNDTPPDKRYRSGMSGTIEVTCHSGNSRSNRWRSRSNTIHGSAPFAEDNGPSAANVHSCVSGSNGSLWTLE